MANTAKKFTKPAYVSNSAANILGATTAGSPAAGLQWNIRRITLTNTDTAATQAVRICVDATATCTAGKELVSKVLAAGETFVYVCDAPLIATVDFLTGIAAAASKVTITVETDISPA